MKRKLIAIFMVFVLAVTLAACGEGEETTLTGMVVSVDGTVISLVEMDTENMGNFTEGERPEMPEGMESFDPSQFESSMPEGKRPEMPEGMEDFDPEQFEGMTPPDGMTMPENGEMPDFSGEEGGMRPGFGNFGEDMETRNVDIADAHISVEIEGGKASGTLDDIQAGTFVTITMNGKGGVTNVLVSSPSLLR